MERCRWSAANCASVIPAIPIIFSQPVNGYPVVSVAEDKLQLHFTT